MSRRREKFRHLAIALTLTTLVASGCIFSPKEDPPVPPQPVRNAEELIQALANAYLQQSYSSFEGLLAEDYLFILDMPNPDTGETQWDRTTEYRIHQRMFDPENIPPGDPPLPTEFWLQTVNITLTPEAAFVERPDLYTTYDPPGTLDPARWKAESATYGTNVFFQLQGDTDFQVNGRAYFTVITDLAKNIGDPGKFLILRWEDLGMNKPSAPSV
jgi:hypothetical protein